MAELYDNSAAQEIVIDYKHSALKVDRHVDC